MNWRTGAVLSFRPMWEMVQPVAFNSMQLKGAELHYPIHEKELLAVIRALKKWHADLLDMTFQVYTDHHTLENFTLQWDLSRHQLRWQEFLSQYDMTITYIKGEDNTVADALSCLPPATFANELPDNGRAVCSLSAGVLSIAASESLLTDIKAGYTQDPFCVRTITNHMSIPRCAKRNGLWYLGPRLLVPCAGTVRKDLFWVAHDAASHFGSDKLYTHLRDSYYWPNMCHDLIKAYIPSCDACQCNKSRTT